MKSPQRMKKYINGDGTVIEMTVKEASFRSVLWEQVKLQFARSCVKKSPLRCRYKTLQLFKVIFLLKNLQQLQLTILYLITSLHPVYFVLHKAYKVFNK